MASKTIDMYKTQIIIAFLFLPLLAATQDSLLIEHLSANTHLLEFKEQELSGPGLALLKEEAKESPFFLIGEAHGMAEIALFTAALYKEIQPFGYTYFATETGPYTAEIIQQMASAENWESQFKQHFTQYPWSIPFYNWKEECNVLRTVLKGHTSDNPIIWGLDQEFAASFRMLFKKLEVEAATPSSKKVANHYYTMAQEAYKEASESKNPGKSFLAVVRPADFEKLRNAFAGQPAALALINEMDESIHIYQMWFSREGYMSNYTRAEMMKKHFYTYYQKAKEKEKQPRVLIKLGASHIYRGLNGLNIPDIGSFVSEIASMEGTQSFHLYVVARKGTYNAYNPFSESDADKQKPHDASEDNDKTDLSAVLKAAPEDKWALIDLRPLRKPMHNHQLKDIQKGLEKIIWSYDAMLVIPEVRAAEGW